MHRTDTGLTVIWAVFGVDYLARLSLAVNRRMRGGLRGRVAVYVCVTTVLVGFVASLAELDAERNAPHATITTFPDAAWWTVSTIATVGYEICTR